MSKNPCEFAGYVLDSPKKGGQLMSSVLFNKITKDPQMLKLPETEKLKKVHKTSI